MTLVVRFNNAITVLTLVNLTIFVLVHDRIVCGGHGRGRGNGRALGRLVGDASGGRIVRLLHGRAHRRLIGVVRFARRGFRHAIASFLRRGLHKLHHTVNSMGFRGRLVGRVGHAKALTVYHLSGGAMLRGKLCCCRNGSFTDRLICDMNHLYRPYLRRVSGGFGPLSTVRGKRFASMTRSVYCLLRMYHRGLRAGGCSRLRARVHGTGSLGKRLSRLGHRRLRHVRDRDNDVGIDVMCLAVVRRTRGMIACAVGLVGMDHGFRMRGRRLWIVDCGT